MSSKQKNTKRGKLRTKQVDQLVRDVAVRSPGVFSDHLAPETYEALAKHLVDSNPAWNESAPDSEAVASEVRDIDRRFALEELDEAGIDNLIGTMAQESASRVAAQAKRHSIGELAEDLWSKLEECAAGTALLYTNFLRKRPARRRLPDTIAASSQGPTLVGVYPNTSTAVSAAQTFCTHGALRSGIVCAIAETRGPIKDWINFEKLVQRAAILGHEHEGTGILIAASGPEGFQHVRHKDEGLRDIGGLGRRHIYSILEG